MMDDAGRIVEALDAAEVVDPGEAVASSGSPAPSTSGRRRGPPPAGGSGGDELDRRLAGLPLTDLGNAKRFLERFGDRFLYVQEWGWLVWDGRRWSDGRSGDGEDAKTAQGGAEQQVDMAVQLTIEAIPAEARSIVGTRADVVVGTKRKEPIRLSDEILEWAEKSQAAGHIACVKQLVQPHLARKVAAFDSEPMAINVLNGTLRVAAHPSEPYVRLDPHRREDLITKLAPVDYDPDAFCPLFDRFMDQVQPEVREDGSKPVQRLLDQWGGLSLTGDASQQMLVFFWGKGRNGKSVWVDTLGTMLGDYSTTIPIETFVDQGRARNAGAATPDLAGLPGIRFLRTSEPEKNAKLAESLIKLVTGGEPIKARNLNKDYFSFQVQFKLTIQGNYRPKIDGTDEGIWGRFILVPWPVFIPKPNRDPHLKTKLLQERSGILNRLLAGLCDWLDNGLAIPDVVRGATDDYRDDSDPLGRFLKVCTRSSIGKRVQSTEMFRVFQAWCKVNEGPNWTAHIFGRAMTERGFASKKSSVVYWLDVEMTKSEFDFIDPHGNPIRQDSVDDD